MPSRRDGRSNATRAAAPGLDPVAAPALQGAPSHRGRVLFLSGHWSVPGDAFTFEAIVTVAADGTAAGPIWWTRARGSRLTGTEHVRGIVSSQSVRLDGIRTDPGLARDRYRIQLSAPDGRGVFTGNSRAFGAWNGRMDGAFEFWTGRSWHI